MGNGSGAFTCAVPAGHLPAGAIRDPFWVVPLEDSLVGGQVQRLKRNWLSTVSSSDGPERGHSLVVSCGGKNPERGVHQRAALTPVLLTLGDIKTIVTMLSRSSREKAETNSPWPLPRWHFRKLHMHEAKVASPGFPREK